MAGAGLAVALLMPSARVLPWRCSRPRQGACRRSCGFPRPGSRRGSSSSHPHLILCVYDLDKDMHATTEVPPEPWFQCGCWRCWNPRAQGWLALLVWASCPGKALAGAAEAAPARVLPGESTSPPCSFMLLVLALLWSSCAPASLRLPSSALLSVAVAHASDCPCTSKGVKRRAPTFVHRHI